MNRVNSAKFLLICMIIAGFLATNVVYLEIPDLLKLTYCCLMAALIGIFMGWLEDK